MNARMEPDPGKTKSGEKNGGAPWGDLARLLEDRPLPSPRAETTRAVLDHARRLVAGRGAAVKEPLSVDRPAVVPRRERSGKAIRWVWALATAASLLASLGIWQAVDFLATTPERSGGSQVVEVLAVKAEKDVYLDEVDQRLSAAWKSVSGIGGTSGGFIGASREDAVLDQWMTRVRYRAADLQEESWDAGGTNASPAPGETPALNSGLPPGRTTYFGKGSIS